jgi:hypothetical protein
MIRRALIMALLVATAADAAKGRKKEDDPLPYDDQTSDDDDRRRELPKRSEEAPSVREETEVEQQDREVSLASDDDPNIGLSGELIMGVNLLESSRGGGFEPMFMGGLRFTWEWSRTFLTDEFWREIFFADVSWMGSGAPSGWSSSGPSWFTGTREVSTSVNYHYFTLAEAFALPLGKTPLAAFASVGIGLGYQTASVYVNQMQTDVSAARFVATFGGGVRARIGLTADDKIRLSFRFETTHVRRGYMGDTFLNASVGVTF